MPAANASTIETRLKILAESERLFRLLWWYFIKPRCIVLPWPEGWTETDPLGNSILSSDPMDHWGLWLKQNVGRRGWDWDWRLAADFTSIEIGFRPGKEQYMLAFRLRWQQ